MSTVTTTTAEPGTEIVDQQTVPPSTFDHAVSKIMEEVGCPREMAVTGLEFIEGMAANACVGERCGTPGTHHLTYEEMDTPGYYIMDTIMEHGATAVAGSAHEAVQVHVLGSDYVLEHHNPSGRKEDCVVTIGVRATG